jgi:hypothetical protein
MRISRPIFSRAFLSTLLAALLLLVSPAAFAQAGGKGTLQGTVTDATGAIIPGAQVTVTQTATGLASAQKTTSAGFYSISSLDPGMYTVTVQAPGFARFVQQNVTLDALQVFGVNAKLQAGGTETTITVSDAPPAIDSTNATLGNTLENETYEALPLNMSGAPRDPTAFVFLTAGVQSTGAPYGSFNGGEGYHNEDYIEGLAVTNPAAAGGGNNSSISRGASVDAIDQFQVQTSGTSAAYQGQGVENYTMKSGTNQFHGRAFEYFRNTVLDTWGFNKSNSAVTGLPVKPVERQNEFGGTLGGPVLRDKLFFFASYDGQRYLRGANPGYITIPTLAQRMGDFSAAGNQNIYDPLTTKCTTVGSTTSCTRMQFVSDGSNGIAAGTPNVIPQNRLAPQSLYYQKFLPLPINTNFTRNYLSGFNTGFTYYKYSVKVDYDVTKKDRLTLLFLTGNRSALPACCDSSGLPPPFTATVGNFQTFPTGVIEDTYTINDHWINQFKYGYVRQGGYSTNPGEGDPSYAATAAGITNTLPGQASMAAPRFGFGGNNAPASLGGTANSNNQANSEEGSSYVLYDTMQFVKGSHSLNFGGQYEWLIDNDTSLTTGTYLNINYSTPETASFLTNSSTANSGTGAAYASFLLGAADNLSQVDQRQVLTTGARFYTFSPFVQDDWKATRKLTLNLGLRWDLYSPFREVHNRLSFLSPTTVNPVTGTPGALTFAGSGPGTCNCQRASAIPFGNFGPHVGFAYAATPRTVIRGAFSIAFTHDGGVGGRGGARQGASQLGFSSNNTVSSPDGYSPALYLNASNSALPAVTPPTQTQSYGTGYSTVPGFTGTGQGVTFVDPYLAKRPPYYENFNVGIQQELFKQFTLNLDYSGSAGRFLPTGMGNGINSDQLEPKYYPLQALLTAKATPATVAAAQAIIPGLTIPATFNPAYTLAQALRPYPQYSGVSDIYGDFGKSSYNSMQVVVTQKQRAGLSYTLNYTWSKMIDNTGSSRSAYDHTGDRSIASYDHPQNISLYGVYAEPFGKGSHFTDYLIRGFEVSGIYRFTSGTPVAITGTGCLTQLSGTCMPFLNPNFNGPIRINGGTARGHTQAELASLQFIDPNAFLPPTGTTGIQNLPNAYSNFGNLVRTAPFGLRAPGGYNVDMSLRRYFGIYERLKLMMEVDAFNLTNRTNFGGPNSGLGNETYSKVSAAAPVSVPTGGSFGTEGPSGASRDIQLVARIQF